MKSEEWSVGSFPHITSSPLLFLPIDPALLVTCRFWQSPQKLLLLPQYFLWQHHKELQPPEGKSHTLASNFELTPAHVNLRLPLLTGRRH